MVQVGIREFKAHLSGYVRRVRAEGVSVAVTARGRVVAVFGPPPAEGQAPAPLPTLRERIRARGGRTAVEHGPLPDLPVLSDEVRQIDAQALLREARGDR